MTSSKRTTFMLVLFQSSSQKKKIKQRRWFPTCLAHVLETGKQLRDVLIHDLKPSLIFLLWALTLNLGPSPFSLALRLHLSALLTIPTCERKTASSRAARALSTRKVCGYKGCVPLQVCTLRLPLACQGAHQRGHLDFNQGHQQPVSYSLFYQQNISRGGNGGFNTMRSVWS